MHYYTVNGESCHEVVGKNGKSRPTTVRDARSRNLVPSVTTIMDLRSKPALIAWLQNQILEAAIASPFNEDWYENGWKEHIIRKSREIGNKAAKRGNEIHDKLEQYFKTFEICLKDVDYIRPAIDLIKKTFPDYIYVAEASFAHKDGFGGRVDLYGYDTNENYIIIDFKTKDKMDVKDMVQYDDHKIQLAAYQVGLQLPSNTRRFNLFISTNSETPGLCKLVECKKFDKYKNLFYALLNLWQVTYEYKPEM